VPVATLEKTLTDAGYSGRATYKSNTTSRQSNKKLEILLRKDAGANTELSGKIAAILEKAHPSLGLSNGEITAVGGLVGQEMTKAAIWSLVLAFLGMILYVGVRYKFTYAFAGIAALVHDVVVSLGIYVFCGRELTLSVAAGLLTIIGYSINDTIVIFDRIREELHSFPQRDFKEVVNESLNRTLSRTFLTSFTTLIVVVVMFFFGGIAINDFMLIMLLGILTGTYSSLYLATPIVVWFHENSNRRKIPAQTAGISAD
ncbi:MAG: protein translocase subunit SecF, partial [Victivallaceae bacterium]|nr:protein translocase subunit SecF [Victivallaceae bacterium]